MLSTEIRRRKNTVGLEQLLPDIDQRMVLMIFSILFFMSVLFFSLRTGEILTWVGKVLNPLFLCFLGILAVRALTDPMGRIGDAVPTEGYLEGTFM